MNERRRELIRTARAGIRGPDATAILDLAVEELEKADMEIESLKQSLDAANREIEQLTKENFWLSNDAAMGIYDKRDVYHDCTVEVLQNSVTGSVSVGWWPNDCPPAGWKMEE